VLLIKCCSDDQIKKSKMKGVCGTCEGGERCIRGFVGKPEAKTHLAGTGRRREDNIKMDFKEIGWGVKLDSSGSG
jgi:hypothetical protein